MNWKLRIYFGSSTTWKSRSARALHIAMGAIVAGVGAIVDVNLLLGDFVPDARLVM